MKEVSAPKGYQLADTVIVTWEVNTFSDSLLSDFL
nr:hypothetical protein [Lacticaseibacillus paracasei]